MIYELEATIPVCSYGNMKPKFTIEEGDDEQVAVDTIKELWRKYGESPLKEKDSGAGVKMMAFTGEELIYDDYLHKYYDLQGNVLLSGSKYAESKKKPFERDKVRDNASKSWGVKSDDVGEVWELTSKISQAYGNAIHYALELYHRHNRMGEKISEKQGVEDNYVISKIPHIKDAVQSFVDEFGADAECEVLVSDVKNKRAGQIDRLEILDMDKKVCRIGDFKTNHTLDKKKIDNYQHQLSFYAEILKEHGWTVEGLDLYHYDGKWTKHELDLLPVE